MYKYQDESGAISITNNLESVPRKYRKVMTVVKEETPSQGKLLPPVVVKKEEPEQVVHSSQEMPDVTPVAQKNNRERYVKTGLAIVGGLVLLVIIRRLTATLGFQKIGTVFCLLMILVGGVYLYGLYIEEMRSVFGNLRRDALNIKKNVDTRELKTEGTLKKIEE